MLGIWDTNHHTCIPLSPRKSCESVALDEEDDVVGHHHLVVFLHARQGRADLVVREVLLSCFVDVVLQVLHVDGLSVG